MAFQGHPPSGGGAVGPVAQPVGRQQQQQQQQQPQQWRGREQQLALGSSGKAVFKRLHDLHITVKQQLQTGANPWPITR